MKFKKVFISIMCFLIAMSFIACGTVKKDDKITWTDTAQREEPDIVDISTFIDYPEILDLKPVIDTSKQVSIGEVASTKNYSIENNVDGIDINYKRVQDWEYFIIPIENYHSLYGNIKLNLSNTGAEKITVQALYYEMRTNDYKAVTIINEEMSEGDNSFVALLSDFNVLDKDYNKTSLSLKDQMLISLLILFDSNPKFPPVDDNKGCVKIKSVDFLKDGDPQLDGMGSTTTVSSRWVLGTSNIRYNNAKDGGFGELFYKHYSTWSGVTFPIKKYKPHIALQMKFTSADSISNLGIAIIVDGQEVVINSSWDKFAPLSSKVIGDDTDANGVRVSIIQELENYIINFDFSNARIDNDGKKVYEKNISGIKLYLLDPSPNMDNAFDGEKKITFNGIEFLDIIPKPPVPQGGIIGDFVNYTDWSTNPGKESNYTIEPNFEGDSTLPAGIKIAYDNSTSRRFVRTDIKSKKDDEVTLVIEYYSVRDFYIEVWAGWDPLGDEITAAAGKGTLKFDLTKCTPIDDGTDIKIWLDSDIKHNDIMPNNIIFTNVYVSCESITPNVPIDPNKSLVVSSDWTTNAPGEIKLNNILEGGMGDMTYTHHDLWYNVNIPVEGYKQEKFLRVKFSSSSDLGVIAMQLNGDGNYTIHDAWGLIQPTTDWVVNGELGKKKIEKVGNDYVFTYDFTGISIPQITSINIYLNDPSSLDIFEGERTISFTGIEFLENIK